MTDQITGYPDHYVINGDHHNCVVPCEQDSALTERTQELIAELRRDLAITARERDAALATSEARRKLLSDAEASNQDMRTQWLTAVGALREMDRRNAELLRKVALLESELPKVWQSALELAIEDVEAVAENLYAIPQTEAGNGAMFAAAAIRRIAQDEGGEDA